MLWKLPFVCLALARSALARGIFVMPGGDKSAVTPLNELSPVRDSYGVSARQAAPPPAPLRILALGASVTFGTGSSTGNSYRKDLRDMLVGAGQTVDFVGEFANGNFTNRQVEATPGFVISQIAGAAGKAVPEFMPNLVLMDAGTNNCNKGGVVPDAGANVTAMINNVFAKSPNSTVILTSILVNSVPEQDACRVDINNQYAALATQMTAQGAKLIMVNMRSSDGPTVADLADGRHPNDVGYQKMATVWFQGVQQAITQGFITAPADNGIPADGGA